MRWVWLQTFEALQTRAGVKAGWVRQVLRETGAKGLWDREGSRGLLHGPTSVVATNSSRTQRANSISEDSCTRR